MNYTPQIPELSWHQRCGNCEIYLCIRVSKMISGIFLPIETCFAFQRKFVLNKIKVYQVSSCEYFTRYHANLNSIEQLLPASNVICFRVCFYSFFRLFVAGIKRKHIVGMWKGLWCNPNNMPGNSLHAFPELMLYLGIYSIYLNFSSRNARSHKFHLKYFFHFFAAFCELFEVFVAFEGRIVE